jgi:hypothetical protein
VAVTWCSYPKLLFIGGFMTDKQIKIGEIFDPRKILKKTSNETLIPNKLFYLNKLSLEEKAILCTMLANEENVHDIMSEIFNENVDYEKLRKICQSYIAKENNNGK